MRGSGESRPAVERALALVHLLAPLEELDQLAQVGWHLEDSVAEGNLQGGTGTPHSGHPHVLLEQPGAEAAP